MVQLVVFLGNPGSDYKRNRHNVGWMLAEALPFFPALNWEKKFKALYTCIGSEQISVSGEISSDAPIRLHFLKPQTYMNLSGESAQAAAAFYKINSKEIIVIHDEIELPFGTISLKFSGGLGGHNGLRSMKACFGNADFWRLRIGIGRPDDRLPGKGGNPENSYEAGIADWVLSDFTVDELTALVPVFDAGAGVLLQALAQGPEHLLPYWTKKNCLAENPSIG
jgi:PTH1 family peptidyl-tRNA hydrolase